MNLPEIIGILSIILLYLSIKKPKVFIVFVYLLYEIFYQIVANYQLTRIFGSIKPIDLMIIIAFIGIILTRNYKRSFNLKFFLAFVFLNIYEILIGTTKFGQMGIGEPRVYVLSCIFIIYILAKIKLNDIEFIVKGIILTGLIIALIAIIWFFSNLILQGKLIRPFGAAQALSVMIAFILFNGFFKNRLNRNLNILINVIFIIGILVLQHRSVWVAFFVSLIILLYTQGKLIKLLPKLLIIIFSIILIHILLKQNQYYQVFLNEIEYRLTFARTGITEDTSGYFRILAWKAEFNKFSQNPILGSGWGNLRLLHPTRGLLTVHIHNGHLTLLSRTGVIGYLFFILFVMQIVLKNRYIQVLYLNIAIIGTLVYSFFYPFVLSLWILMGLSLLLDYFLRNNEIRLLNVSYSNEVFKKAIV